MASFPHSFRPRLLDALKAYSGRKFTADLGAGITVGLVALPLAMAFAIASGVKPESGIFTTIIAGFIISALGGSRVQIGGPAGAFIVIIYGIIQQYGLANLLIATMMAGILLFAMGITGVGSLVRYIPIGIVIGFTNGIAVLIGASQLKDFLGLKIAVMPADFFSQVAVIARSLSTVNVSALALAAACLAIIIVWPRVTGMTPRGDGFAPSGRAALFSRLPATVVALVLATIAAIAFHLPVETIGSRFGGIPQTLPAFALPELHWQSARNLVGPTLTIALLGAIESLMCARVADAMINDRHDPNQELMAQGIANFVTPLFGGLPATGTIARTTLNIRSGAASLVAGIVHAFTLLAVVLLAAPLAAYVPLAALAAILLFVAWNMGEWKEFARLRHFSMNYRIIMVSTFLLTVIFDLSIAVEIGLVLASLLFIFRVSALTRVDPIDLAPHEAALDQKLAVRSSSLKGEDPHIVAYKLFGSVFFGAIGKVESLLDYNRERVSVVILEMHQVINVDTTGLDTLELLHRTLREEGRHLVLADVTAQPLSLLRRSGFGRELGEDNIAANLEQAIVRARQLVVQK